MALTVEDGTIVAGADSYASQADFSAYAALMGLTLTGDAASQEIDMRRAGAYLDRQFTFVGRPVNRDQTMEWPRYYEDEIEGVSLPTNEVPVEIVQAQYEIAYLFNSGNDLFAYTSGAAVKKTKVVAGPVSSETEYEGASDVQSRTIAVEGLLDSFITGGTPGAESGVAIVRRA